MAVGKPSYSPQSSHNKLQHPKHPYRTSEPSLDQQTFNPQQQLGMANYNVLIPPIPIFKSVLLPIGSPPYETPIDLRFPLHFAPTGPRNVHTATPSIRRILNNISEGLDVLYKCQVRIVNSQIFAARSTQKTPWYFCVDSRIGYRKAAGVDELVDFKTVYEDLMIMIREEFTDHHREDHEFLRRPIVRFRMVY